MAKVIKKSSHLEKEYRRKQRHALRWFLLSLLGVLLLVAGLSPMQPVLLTVGMVWFVWCVFFALLPVRNLNALKTGIQGESDAATLLQDLPEGYLCLQNATVTYRGKESEMDLVVAGAAGVFIVEVKNRNGRITGAYEEKDWTQHKIGRAGGEYASVFYNPTKQVGTHIYRLAHYLRGQGCQVHIDGAVLFSNPDTALTLSGEPGEIPVFSGADGGKNLLQHIRSHTPTLPPERVKQVISLLKKL